MSRLAASRARAANGFVKRPPLIGIGLLALSLLTACTTDSPGLSKPSSERLPSESAPPSPPIQTASRTPEPSASASSEPYTQEATLLAVGDIMVHMPQLPAYYNKAGDRYDLRPWFSQVRPILQTGDWVVGNLETPIAGKDLKYTGYPRFNAPDELAAAIRYSGIELVSTANNHTLDRGVPGVTRTLAAVRKAGLIPFGSSASATDQRRLVIEERNGIRMGFLSYTYGTNGIPIPSGRAYAVNLIDPDTIKKDIAKLRQADADVVTVSLHFGVEYQRMPNQEQTKLVKELIRSGADIILGSHPHVVQPYDMIEISAAESRDGKARTGIVIYSLGNFISNQTGSWKDVGLIFGVRMTKTTHPNGVSEIQWNEITTEPTWVHIIEKQKKRHYTVIPLRSELKQRSFAELTAQDYAKMKTMLKGLDQHLQRLQAS